MAGLFEVVPNFAEGRDQAVCEELGGSDKLDVHRDPAHNRTVVTLAGLDPDVLLDRVMERIATAVRHLDLRRHTGLHPRVGVADVVPFVPLGDATLDGAIAIAERAGRRIWEELEVPVCFYGAMAGGRSLAEIRRGGVAPDLGEGAHPSAGVCCVGARPLLVAYNIDFPLPPPRVREIATEMRRLPGVLALAFPLEHGRTQLSMNLSATHQTGAADAFAAATVLAGVPGGPELVGLCPAHAAGPGCAGGLLEGRLAAAGANRAASLAEGMGGDERARIASRLRAQAPALAATGTLPDDILRCAEQAAALRRVVRAAGVRDAEVDALLALAARGLRESLDQAGLPDLAIRIGLLDRWLAEPA